MRGIDLNIGKLPPQAIDMEEVVLGAVMIEKEAISRVVQWLKPEMFYKEDHSLIYAACLSLYNAKQPIDQLMVVKELRKSGELERVGGALAITQLTNKVASTANLEFHAAVIAEKYAKREVIRIGNELIKDAFDEEIESTQLIDSFTGQIQALTQNQATPDAKPINEITKAATKEVESRLSNEFGTSGYAKGIRAVDRLLGGYQKTDLIYIAGRPGMGKSSDMLSDALRMAQRGIAVAIFSLEMGEVQLTLRLAAQISGIDVEVLVKQRIDGDRLNDYYRAVDVINKLPIYINDTGSLSVYDLRNKVARLVKKQKVEIVFVDYVQLMSVGQAASKKLAGNREQEISIISRTLKLIAKENNIPMVVLAQLSRQTETRGGSKRPILSDLRESGSLEQDADVVAFIYRPEYYGIKETDDGKSTDGLGQFIVAKHRNGGTGEADMRFIKYLAQYTDFDDSWTPRESAPHPDHRLEPNKNFLAPKDDAPF